ncbi:MAG: beta-lactamase family protein [Bacteroidetes bacterium]|nr:beta-lactamase family protein [Bacteroidota bacterium]
MSDKYILRVLYRPGIYTYLLLISACTQAAKKTSDHSTRNDLQVESIDSSLHFSKDREAAIAGYFQTMHQRWQYSGSTLVYQRDSFYQWCAGSADSAHALTLKMPMQIASLSKPFCATAVMQMILKNKLKLSDSLRHFFPELPYHSVTIEHLLSHSSGIPEYVFFADHHRTDSSGLLTNAGVIQLFAEKKPPFWFAPGKKHHYVNTNFVLLASILEKISGKPYPALLQELIFKPLGMLQTRVLSPGESVLGMPVQGHYGNGAVFPDDYQDGTYGDKNIVSTASDLFRFYRGLRDNTLFPEVMRTVMTRVRWSHARGESDYGLGWRRREIFGEDWIFHTGWWHGFRANFYFCFTSDKCVVTLSNRLSGGFLPGTHLAAFFKPEEMQKIMSEM